MRLGAPRYRYHHYPFLTGVVFGVQAGSKVPFKWLDKDELVVRVENVAAKTRFLSVKLKAAQAQCGRGLSENVRLRRECEDLQARLRMAVLSANPTSPLAPGARLLSDVAAANKILVKAGVPQCDLLFFFTTLEPRVE